MLPVLDAWRSPSNPLKLNNFIHVIVGSVQNRDYLEQYPVNRRTEIQIALTEAWTWLEGAALLIPDPGYHWPSDIRILSRRARQLAAEPSPHRAFAARRFPKEELHPRIQEDVWALYHRGKYDTAVFEAMKAVEVAVRDAAGLAPADIGTKLMRKSFDVENGPLTDKSAEQAERQARSDLFAGAIGSYKNPHSHRDVALEDPNAAAEIIMLANHLLRIVDARTLLAMLTP